jgi:gliding motility-associated-like protein
VPGPNTTYTPSLADLAANTITLTLTGTSTLGCLPTATTVTVGFTNPPIPNPGANTIVCTNSSTLQLNGTIPGGAGGLWNSSGTGLFFPNNAILNPTYNLSVGDLTLTTIVFSLTSIPIPSTNCAGETRTMVVNVIPKPVVDAGPDRIACASSSVVLLNGSVSGAATTGSWSTTNGSGTFPPPNGVPTATYLLGPGDISTGTVVVVLNSTPGTCPTAADTAKLFIVTDPIITVNTNTTVCNNAKVPCTGTITGAVNTGFWTASPGGGVFSPTNNLLGVLYQPSAADLAAGIIVISLHPDPTACGNGPAKSFTVTVINSPKALFNYPVYGKCLGVGVPYSDASLPNGSSNLSYNWNFGDGLGSISTATNPIYTYSNSGSYLVTLTVTGNNNCFDTVTRRVAIAPNPISEFSVASACQGINSLFLSTSQAPSGGGAINALIWDWNDGTPVTVSSGATFTNSAVHIYTSASQYIASLTASTTLGCINTSTRVVNISQQPNAEFGMTNNPNVAQEPVYFSDFSSPTGSNFSYYWQFGDEKTASESNPTHIYQNAGVYVIKLTITDTKGCSDTISKSIDINLLPQVPTAFTPNGDNNNDLLFLKGGPFARMKFRVYNNWGELLFETTDQKVGWDGKKNGAEQPIGVYVWTLEVDMYNNRQVKKNGDVTLIR